jgi:general L-amino acid transport system permease protein
MSSPAATFTNAPPSVRPATPVDWLKKNLFSTWYNVIISIILLSMLGNILYRLVSWALGLAQWKVIPANLPLYFVGQFPVDQYWRLWLLLGMITSLAGLSWGAISKNARPFFGRSVLIIAAALALLIVITPTPLPYRLGLLAVEILLFACGWIGHLLANQFKSLWKVLSVGWSLSFLAALFLLVGGLGLKTIQTNMWGGLLLTLIAAVVSSIAAFPIGILIALARQSPLPIIRWVATLYVEFIRGTPLTAILFIGSVMLPYFLPTWFRPDLVLRTIVALIMFCSAYLAETVRSGLQAIPKGQYEAASALGLNKPLALMLIILPQALKIVIPDMVGLFIQMVQETTLISIVGLSELFRISRSILSNPQFIGRYAEVYLFIGLLYWAICYSMSIASRRLEKSLKTTH